MPLFIPFLLMGGASVLGSLGVKKGYAGINSMREAKALGERVQERHQCFIARVHSTRDEVNAEAARYGKLKLEMRQKSFGRLLRLLEQLAQRAGLESMAFLKSVDVQQEELADFKVQYLEAESTLKGVLTAGVAGATAASTAYTMAGLVGVASTGTAISGLSGAALTNATLAWLGGGSLAAGGFGMAGGMVVLGGVVAGPALAIGGFLLASEGEKALTKAQAYAAEVERAIADLEKLVVFLRGIERRLIELRNLVTALRTRLDAQLDELEHLASNFDINKRAHCEQLRMAMQLAKALSEVMKTPVLDAEGQLNTETVRLISEYQDLAT